MLKFSFEVANLNYEERSQNWIKMSTLIDLLITNMIETEYSFYNI
jgi:hypothetical protein